MRPLCYAISMLVVTGYTNVIKVVLLGKVCDCFDDQGSVMGNNFVKSAPMTDDVFKYTFSDSISIFSSKHLEFGIMD